MAGFSEEDIRRVREASEITAVFSDRVPLRQRGRDFWCCCPIHEERTPSCKIDPAAQLWHCFGCGAGGDVFSLIMQADGLDFPDAVRKLADRANITIEERGSSPQIKGHKARLKEVCKQTADFYHNQLMRGKGTEAASARKYLADRGFGGAVPKGWLLGFAPGKGALVAYLKSKGFTEKEMIDANVALKRDSGPIRDRFYERVMFPILDSKGECIAFGGRIVGSGEPKYLNSQETPIFHKSEVLYGLDKAKGEMAATGVAVVVEGYTDVIALHEAGVSNAVATLGTALTTQHIRILARHAKNQIVYLFDGDEAGQRAADRALEFIDETITPEAGRRKVDLAAVVLPQGLDPADFVAKNGGEALKGLIAQAKSLIRYGIERRVSRYDLSRPEDRAQAAQDALSILAPIKDSLLAKDYAVEIAGKTRMREEDVLDQLKKLEAPRAYSSEGQEEQASQSAMPAVVDISPSEKSRRRYERKFLILCAQNPEIGLKYAESLAQTGWHDPAHARLSEALLEVFANDPKIKPAEVITSLQKTIPTAPQILTADASHEGVTPERYAQFLSETLLIGDLEESIDSLKAQLKDPDLAKNAQEYELVFESIVAMQKDLNARLATYRPL